MLIQQRVVFLLLFVCLPLFLFLNNTDLVRNKQTKYTQKPLHLQNHDPNMLFTLLLKLKDFTHIFYYLVSYQSFQLILYKSMCSILAIHVVFFCCCFGFVFESSIRITLSGTQVLILCYHLTSKKCLLLAKQHGFLSHSLGCL